MKAPPAALACLLALAASSSAQTRPVDDADLAGPRRAPVVLQGEGRREGGRTVFKAQSWRNFFRNPFKPSPAATLSGTISLTDPGGLDAPARLVEVAAVGPGGELARTETADDGSWTLQVPSASGPVSVRFRLKNALWAVVDPASGQPYEWEAAPGSFRLEPGTQNAKLGWIHLQFLEARDFLAKQGVLTGWWKNRLAVNVPGSGDFFSPGSFSLDLTQPEAWDVNLHELGHAVMAAGTRSFGGGGAHKIDECYNQGLAWSEGWATFFAGAVRLSSADADAKFQYLVPRRAPIRIENVPDDVCRGDSNEWRVAAGLWDLYDVHEDGRDHVAVSFQRLWKALEGQAMGSFPDAWTRIQKALSPGELVLAVEALRQNTLLPEGGASVRAGRPFDLGAFASPRWDGAR